MNFIKNAYGRVYQFILKVASNFMDFSEPKVYENMSLKEIPQILRNNLKRHVLLVTDENIFSLGLVNPLINSLEANNVGCEVFHHVVANPTIDNVEDGLKIYLEHACDSLIAVGGGSAMDCCKAIGARVVNPKKPVNKMKGLLKVRRKIPFMIAVPTTAGTGSETTVAAVIVDKKNNDKYAINDPHLIPDCAVFVPELLVNLPSIVSATTGMDALTHAVEAFIGNSNTAKTEKYAADAVKLIFKYLEKSVKSPKNLEYRNKMQLASYKAGVAFTRAYVGSVHAIAHSLGGLYNVPHGFANAIILPIVLKKFGKDAEKRLAILATEVGLNGNNEHESATKFIEAIEKMNQNMGVQNTFGKLIIDRDLPFLVEHTYREAYPLYPTPRILERSEYNEIYKELAQ